MLTELPLMVEEQVCQKCGYLNAFPERPVPPLYFGDGDTITFCCQACNAVLVDTMQSVEVKKEN